MMSYLVNALQFVWLTPTAPYSDFREGVPNLPVAPFAPFLDHRRLLVLLRQALFPLIHLSTPLVEASEPQYEFTVLAPPALALQCPCHCQLLKLLSMDPTDRPKRKFWLAPLVVQLLSFRGPPQAACRTFQQHPQ